MEAGKHGYSGSCSPGTAWSGHFETFSYGIFEWVLKSGGKGVKKSVVKVRVSGPSSMPEAIKAKAQEIVLQLDAGTYKGPKKVKI